LPRAVVAQRINYDMGCVERYCDASGFTSSDNAIGAESGLIQVIVSFIPTLLVQPPAPVLTYF
jgi:hypothetical protein